MATLEEQVFSKSLLRIGTSAKFYKLGGLGFLGSGSYFYPKKGQHLGQEIQEIFLEIEKEVAKYNCMKEYLECY